MLFEQEYWKKPSTIHIDNNLLLYKTTDSEAEAKTSKWYRRGELHCQNRNSEFLICANIISFPTTETDEWHLNNKILQLVRKQIKIGWVKKGKKSRRQLGWNTRTRRKHENKRYNIEMKKDFLYNFFSLDYKWTFGISMFETQSVRPGLFIKFQLNYNFRRNQKDHLKSHTTEGQLHTCINVIFQTGWHTENENKVTCRLPPPPHTRMHARSGTADSIKPIKPFKWRHDCGFCNWRKGQWGKPEVLPKQTQRVCGSIVWAAKVPLVAYFYHSSHLPFEAETKI